MGFGHRIAFAVYSVSKVTFWVRYKVPQMSGEALEIPYCDAYTQLAKMSFGEISDRTAAVYFNFFVICTLQSTPRTCALFYEVYWCTWHILIVIFTVQFNP